MLLRSATVRDLDRLTARVFDTSRNSGARLDAYRIDETYFIDIDLPGVDPAGIDVTVDHKVLTVRATRHRLEGDNVQVLVAERPTGTVSRSVFLSETLDTDRLDAGYENGVLTLRIPVTGALQPRKFEVTAATTASTSPSSASISPVSASSDSASPSNGSGSTSSVSASSGSASSDSASPGSGNASSDGAGSDKAGAEPVGAAA